MEAESSPRLASIETQKSRATETRSFPNPQSASFAAPGSDAPGCAGREDTNVATNAHVATTRAVAPHSAPFSFPFPDGLECFAFFEPSVAESVRVNAARVASLAAATMSLICPGGTRADAAATA